MTLSQGQCHLGTRARMTLLQKYKANVINDGSAPISVSLIKVKVTLSHGKHDIATTSEQN